MTLVAQVDNASRKTNAPKSVHATVPLEAVPISHRGDFETMARRRFQDPNPKREGQLLVLAATGRMSLSKASEPENDNAVKLAPASMPEREVKKIAAEILRPMNQGLISVGSAVTLTNTWTANTCRPYCRYWRRPRKTRYSGVIRKYLMPAFGIFVLRDLTPRTLQRYFSGMATQGIRTLQLSKFGMRFRAFFARRFPIFLITNPLDGLRLPQRQKRQAPKPIISPDQFNRLVQLVPEPYATMLYVAVWTGLASERTHRLEMALHSPRLRSRSRNGIAAGIGQHRRRMPVRRRLPLIPGNRADPSAENSHG